MHRGMGGGTAFEPVEQRRDRELTLGPLLLVGLIGGLVVLCGLCFMAGYAAGHRAPIDPATAMTEAPAVSPTSSLPNAEPKPSASQGAPQPVAEAPETASNSGTSQGQVQPAVQETTSGAAPPQVVQAALPQSNPSAAVSQNTGTVQPALSQGTPWMVQIAAVSHPEDAEVLVGALRKHGYAVSSHRDPADGLLHVRVGPFATHNDAAAMRQKLLNDGYNAIIQP